MNTVLCYGDSLTWGSDPATGGRHAASYRWPDVLEAELGGGVKVIADGLRGRTTAYDEHLAECDRNGVRILPTTLYTHAPLDLVILFLGANDMKPHIAGTAIAAMQGMRRLVEIALTHNKRTGEKQPKVLLVSPPPLCETPNEEFAGMFAGGVSESRKLAKLYAGVAKETGAAFFDAGSVAQTDPADGVHVSAQGTRAIGLALVPLVRDLLAS